MRDKKLLFEIDGFKVYDNSLYYVKDKIDYDAPTGFEKAGVSKLPHDGVGDYFNIRFNPTDSSGREGTWDTGFFPGSKCYSNITDKAAEIVSKNLWENVAIPYMKATSISEDKLSPSSDNDWWEKRLFEVSSEKVYNTAKPIQRFELYFSLLTGKLTPEGQEGNAKYKFPKSSYVVVDIESKKKRKDEVTDMEFEAIGTFMALLRTDKDALKKVLDYIGLSVSDEVGDSTFRTMFKDFIKSSESKMRLYNKLIEEISTDEGRMKIEIYSRLKKRYPNKGVTKTRNGDFEFEGFEIGGDLKTAAQNIATRSEFSDIKKTLLIEEV